MKITMVDLHGQYERIREEINNAIQEVLDTTAFINGPQVKTFAQHLAVYNQVEHVVPCANGTDAYLRGYSRSYCPFTAGTHFRGLCRRPFHDRCYPNRGKNYSSHESNRSCSLVWPMRRHGTTYGYSPPTQTLRGRRHCTSYRGHLHVQ